MAKFTVDIYAVDWCGFSHYYEVEAENEDDAEDKALELYEQDFVDMFCLLLTEDGYIESDDYDSETEEYDEDDCSTLGTRIVD